MFGTGVLEWSKAFLTFIIELGQARGQQQVRLGMGIVAGQVRLEENGSQARLGKDRLAIFYVHSSVRPFKYTSAQNCQQDSTQTGYILSQAE